MDGMVIFTFSYWFDSLAKTFKVNGQRDNKTGIIVGDLEAKYADKLNGVSFTEAWTTSNHLNGKIELENNLASKVENILFFLSRDKELIEKNNNRRS